MASNPPQNLKQINSYLRLAKEYDKRDATVAYFCRMFAVQKGIKLDSKTPECKTFLFSLMDQLELTKKGLANQESVSNEIVAQAHVENVALQLFAWADTEDRKGVFNKNVTKSFFSSSLLFDVLCQFGELNDECKIKQKYAKWKATYLHRCLQTGETPQPGPEGSGFEDEFNSMNMPAVDSNLPGYPEAPSSMNPPPADKPVPAPRVPSAHQSPPAESVDEPNYHGIDFTKATKLCKYAVSAIQYEDVPSAIDNLTQALNILQNR